MGDEVGKMSVKMQGRKRVTMAGRGLGTGCRWRRKARLGRGRQPHPETKNECVHTNSWLVLLTLPLQQGLQLSEGEHGEGGAGDRKSVDISK